MANRTYLVQSSSSGPADYNPDRDILAAASYCIPAFWYALFDQKSIVGKMVEMDDGTASPYPYLVTATSAARSRFNERKALLQYWLPPPLLSRAENFTKLLDGVEARHIHLETVELWAMDEPEKFQPHLETCLRAFELPRDSLTPSALLKTREWKELLDQAGIDAADLESMNPDALTGYGWARPVTWR